MAIKYNERHADLADAAIEAYRSIPGYAPDDGDDLSLVRDMIQDLMHWVARQMDADKAIRKEVRRVWGPRHPQDIVLKMAEVSNLDYEMELMEGS